MSEEILINVTPMESRVAVVENGVVQEIHLERTQHRGIVGNIYQGKVVRVLPGMQAAFVEIGLARTAFIHAADLLQPAAGIEAPISSLLREGQSLLVQVSKDPIGSKGARLSSELSIPSRYLVYMPGGNHIGVSLRIEDESERERLRQILGQALEAEGISEAGGFILRTVAEGMNAEDIRADIRYLRRLWEQIQTRMQSATVPALIYEDLPLALRTLRDLFGPRTEKLRIDSREVFQKISSFAEELMPEAASRLEHYPGERPIFDLYGIEDEIQRALERKVPLKHRTLEETLFKTNLEAATAIGRQLRLRNLGGIIIIDFIDMAGEEHRRQVLRTLERQLERDHAKTHMVGITELGLVQLTRKRTRESLEQILCETCPCCGGRGTLKTAETVCYEIFREILREERAFGAGGYRVLASQTVVDRLLDEESANVADLEAFIGRPIRFQVESLYSQEQYDVVLL